MHLLAENDSRFPPLARTELGIKKRGLILDAVKREELILSSNGEMENILRCMGPPQREYSGS